LLALVPERATPDQLIAAVESADPKEVWLTIWGIHIPPMVEELGLQRLHRAADGDREAAAELRRLARSFDESKGLDAALKMSPPKLKDAVLSTLTTWYHQVFVKREAATMPILEADEMRIKGLLKEHSPERVIELAGRGLDYRPEPWAARVVLIPHIAMRPWTVMGARDSDYLICFPVDDETIGMEPGAPPADLVRLHRALGDEKRLRILKMLAGAEELGLQDLADGAGLAKSSTHYHMVVLRAAGLVSVTTGGRSRYRLRRDMLPRTAAMLGEFLGEHP
jgi:DNA-binding transcriptional ArsR family regulator